MKKKTTVLVVGASPKEDRYSHKAMRLLLDKGYDAIPLHPSAKLVCSVPAVKEPFDVKRAIDTVTMYVSALHGERMADGIVALKPRRIIFNPGAENDFLETKAIAAGIEVLHACTLVMLNTGQF